jgi:hypothetical protein
VLEVLLEDVGAEKKSPQSSLEGVVVDGLVGRPVDEGGGGNNPPALKPLIKNIIVRVTQKKEQTYHILVRLLFVILLKLEFVLIQAK